MNNCLLNYVQHVKKSNNNKNDFKDGDEGGRLLHVKGDYVRWEIRRTGRVSDKYKGVNTFP